MNSCDLFRQLAIETWQRIGLVRRHKGLKIFETTITQNILFQILKTHLTIPSGRVVLAFEARNEAVHGNDIELFIEVSSGVFRFFPAQAKIVYGNGKYGGFKGLVQCASLINYAQQTGGTPIHLFYNYGPGLNVNQTALAKIGKKVSASDLLYYGCSFAHSFNVFGSLLSTRSPRMDFINYNFALPWHLLVCGGVNFTDTFQKKSFSEKDVTTNNSEWKKLDIREISRSQEDYWTESIDDSGSVQREQQSPLRESERLKIRKGYTGDRFKVTDGEEAGTPIDIDVGQNPVEKLNSVGASDTFSPKFRIVVRMPSTALV